MNFVECESFKNTNLASLLNQPNEKNIITKKHPNFQTIVEGNLWIVDNFFSTEECDNLLKKIEDLGFHDALLNVGYNKQILAKDVRDCKRCMIDDFESTDIIKKRLINILPLANQGGILSSVNERLRFLKYVPGNKFETHMDGRFSREIGGLEETSVFTIQIYLSEGFLGGETIFYDDNFWKDGKFKCEPKKGRIAIFRQYGFLHCGATVFQGTKYTIRTDIMYRRVVDTDVSIVKDSDQVCGFCESPLFFKECKTKFEKVPSCKCPHTYGIGYETFPCIACSKMTSYKDLEESKSKCQII